MPKRRARWRVWLWPADEAEPILYYQNARTGREAGMLTAGQHALRVLESSSLKVELIPEERPP